MFFIVYHVSKKEKRSLKIIFTIGIFAAFCLKIYLASRSYSQEGDIYCFRDWADRLYNNGFKAFYAPGEFSDYPPGYLYFLYIAGFLRSVGLKSLLILKLPSLICDFLLAFLAFYISKKEKQNKTFSLGIALLILTNPCGILNSSLWGQVDSVLTFMLIAVCVLLTYEKLETAYFIYALSLLIKPQALILAPVLLFVSLKHIKRDHKKIIISVLGAVILILLLSAPFGVRSVITQYSKTLSSYPYKSLNAFNLWAFLGQNYKPVTVFSSAIGYMFIVFATAFALFIFKKSKEKYTYFLMTSVLYFTVAMLCVKMHERYSYPAVFAMIFTFIYSKEIIHGIYAALITVAHYINTAYVFYIMCTAKEFHMNKIFVEIFSFINLMILTFIITSIFKSLNIKKESGDIAHEREKQLTT